MQLLEQRYPNEWLINTLRVDSAVPQHSQFVRSFIRIHLFIETTTLLSEQQWLAQRVRGSP